ncbi:unnamed protein product [Vitrella brassicaformis CCMP3155]|uniref:Uncharacterized protein n=2 Tax=Vitrella brassicaformis TaxID=1169539 RepID=A0A0G4H5Y5_VITBC|nr:unnamed protein product [Vitrella brassicaformis CCMP3155]|eukprot:CEM39095.1 unnamed protein product [Vitrella brassicaformis CCMP3155]
MRPSCDGRGGEVLFFPPAHHLLLCAAQPHPSPTPHPCWNPHPAAQNSACPPAPALQQQQEAQCNTIFTQVAEAIGKGVAAIRQTAEDIGERVRHFGQGVAECRLCPPCVAAKVKGCEEDTTTAPDEAPPPAPLALSYRNRGYVSRLPPPHAAHPPSIGSPKASPASQPCGAKIPLKLTGKRTRTGEPAKPPTYRQSAPIMVPAPARPPYPFRTVRLEDVGPMSSSHSHVRKMRAIPLDEAGNDLPLFHRPLVVCKKVGGRAAYQDRHEVGCHFLFTRHAESPQPQTSSSSPPGSSAAAPEEQQPEPRFAARVMPPTSSRIFRRVAEAEDYGFIDLMSPHVFTPFGASGSGSPPGEAEGPPESKSGQPCIKLDGLDSNEFVMLHVPRFPPGSGSVLPLLPHQQRDSDWEDLVWETGLNNKPKEQWAEWRAKWMEEDREKSALPFDDIEGIRKELERLGVVGTQQDAVRVLLIKDLVDKTRMMHQVVVPKKGVDYYASLTSQTTPGQPDILAKAVTYAKTDGSPAVYGDLTPSNALVCFRQVDLELKGGSGTTGRFVVACVVFVDASVAATHDRLSCISGKLNYETLENNLTRQLEHSMRDEGVTTSDMWLEVAGPYFLRFSERSGWDRGEDIWALATTAMKGLQQHTTYDAHNQQGFPPIDAQKAAYLYATAFSEDDRPAEQQKVIDSVKKRGEEGKATAAHYEKIYAEQFEQAEWPDTLCLCANGVNTLTECEALRTELVERQRERYVPASLRARLSSDGSVGVDEMVKMVEDGDLTLTEAAIAIVYTNNHDHPAKRAEGDRLLAMSSQLGDLLDKCSGVQFKVPKLPRSPTDHADVAADDHGSNEVIEPDIVNDGGVVEPDSFDSVDSGDNDGEEEGLLEGDGEGEDREGLGAVSEALLGKQHSDELNTALAGIPHDAAHMADPHVCGSVATGPAGARVPHADLQQHQGGAAAAGNRLLPHFTVILNNMWARDPGDGLVQCEDLNLNQWLTQQLRHDVNAAIVGCAAFLKSKMPRTEVRDHVKREGALDRDTVGQFMSILQPYTTGIDVKDTTHKTRSFPELSTLSANHTASSAAAAVHNGETDKAPEAPNSPHAAANHNGTENQPAAVDDWRETPNGHMERGS